MTFQTKVAATTPRIYGLDVWRAALLLVTPLVHAALVARGVTDYRGLLPDDIAFASHYFRMPMFFCLSGFLSAHAERKNAGWLGMRVRQLGVPLLFVWVCLLTPLTLGLAIASPARGNVLDPMHLWFLVTLLIVSVPVYLVDRWSAFTFLVLARPNVRRAFALSLVIGAGAGFGQYVVWAAGWPALAALVLASPIYGFFYLLGFAVQRNPAFLDAVKATRLTMVGPVLWVALVLANHFLYAELHTEHHRHLLRAVTWGMTGVASVFLCLTMFASALRITHRPQIAARLTKASYTIYLVHVPLLFLFALAVEGRITSFWVLAPLLLVSVTLVSFYIHEAVVEKSSWAAYLLNGQRRARFATWKPRPGTRAHCTADHEGRG